MRPLELSVVVKEEGEKEEEEKFTLSLPDGTRHKQVPTFLHLRPTPAIIIFKPRTEHGEYCTDGPPVPEFS
jgi:hypothetical protein